MQCFSHINSPKEKRTCWNRGGSLRKYTRSCGYICVCVFSYPPMYMVGNISLAILTLCKVFECVRVHACVEVHTNLTYLCIVFSFCRHIHIFTYLEVMKGLIFLDVRNRVASTWTWTAVEFMVKSIPCAPREFITQHSHWGTSREVGKPWSHPSSVMMLLPSCQRCVDIKPGRFRTVVNIFSWKCNFFPLIVQSNLKTKTLKYPSRTPMWRGKK